MGKTITALLFIALAVSITNVVAQTQMPHYIAMTSKTNAYFEYLPQGYNASGTSRYPLILYIHGNSERGTGDSVDMLKISGRGLPKVMMEAGFPTSFTVNATTYRFIVISPQFGPRPEVLDVDSVLTYILKHYPIDTTRIYLTGFSMGGGACWDYAGSIPRFTNTIAALVPVSGSGVPDTIKTRTIASANLPVWATHNDSDQTVPVSTTNTYISWINKAPAPTPMAKKTIFHSTSHNAWAATYDPNFRENGLNVFEWMLQYKRRPMPPTGPKSIKVNVYGGVNAYSHLEWNNWNVSASLSSGALRYNDATTSAVHAVVTNSSGVHDNGDTYGAGMAPAEVLRYTSSGNDPRSLTFSHLTLSSTYDLELYASRNNTGQSTKFTIGSKSVTVVTDKNLTSKASFVNLVPSSSGQLVVSIANVSTYNYLNGFILTEHPNKVPVVNAGTDKSITLPTASVTLTGTASDADGTIAGYKWTQVSGPSTATLSTPAAASTTASALTQGTYVFRLSATDNKGGIGSDDVKVVVNAVADTKHIKVNLFGGINPYNNGEWNNWNVSSSLSSGDLKYSDASVSKVNAALSASSAVVDNGSAYGGTMAPPEVLRYASSANVIRTLTLNGLSPSKTYTLELYASRARTGYSTVFTVGTTSLTIVTDSNKTTKATFTNLKANASGQLQVGIKSGNGYNYLNGFILTEISNTTASITRAHIEAVSEPITSLLQMRAYPNPTHSYFTLLFQSSSNKPVQLRIVDVVGSTVELCQGVPANNTMHIGYSYSPGIYYAEVLQEGRKASGKLLKKIQ